MEEWYKRGVPRVAPRTTQRASHLAGHLVGRLVGLTLGVALCACDGGPDEAELDRMLEEARAAERTAQAAHEHEDEATLWTLTILGETGADGAVILRNADLEAASDVTVGATPPLEGAAHGRYRGARISELLARAGGARAGVSEVTLVASDGFRATIALDDLVRSPILLATFRDDVRLRREDGGPLLAVFPLDDVPSLLDRYTESWWVYYVTHLVVGTPPPSLRAFDRAFDEAALAALPVTEIVASVGYRVGWPSEPERIAGPSVAALLDAAGVTLPPGARIRVTTLAPVTRGPDRPTYLSAEEIGEVIVARTHGADDAPIPARLGGPLVLGLTPERAAHHPDHDWLTFVTDLTIEVTE